MKRTPLRLEDLNYESDYDDEDSDVEEEDGDEEDYEETESEADDDIFQTSYYVPSGRTQKKAALTNEGRTAFFKKQELVLLCFLD